MAFGRETGNEQYKTIIGQVNTHAFLVDPQPDNNGTTNIPLRFLSAVELYCLCVCFFWGGEKIPSADRLALSEI